MQDETPDTCVVCQETIVDDLAYPCTEHMLHAKCASRWFHSQILQGNEMKCPVCRQPPANGWRIFEVRSKVVSARRIGLPVGPDTTVNTIKEHLTWLKAFPPNSVRLFTMLSLNETTKRPMIMQNTSWVGAMSGLYIYNEFVEAEYLFLDLPSGQTSTDKKYVCPLSQGLLLNPTRAAAGLIYEQSAIVRWVQTRGNSSPKIPGRPIQPLVRLHSPQFNEAVRAIQTVNWRPPTTDLTREITVNVICPQIGERPFTVRYGDTMISIAHRAMPNMRRLMISTANCVIYKFCDNPAFTVAQAYVKNGATLYVINMG